MRLLKFFRDKGKTLLEVIAAIVTIFIFVTGIEHLSGHKDAPVENKTVNNTTTIKAPENAHAGRLSTAGVEGQASGGAYAAKRPFLAIYKSDASEKWDNNLSSKLTEVFKEKGFDAVQANSAPADANPGNIIVFTLTLSGGDTKKNAFEADVTEYELELALKFCSGRKTDACQTGIYRQKVAVSSSDDRDQVLTQGVTGLIARIKTENNFPFVVQKK